MNVPGRRSLSIGILGAGRLGSALTAALLAAGYHVTVASRTADHARRLGAALDVPALKPARLVDECDLVFLAVPDGAIDSVAAALPWRAGHFAVHCSGALGLDALDAAAERGASVGCLHPLQSFPTDIPPAETPALFRGIACGIEAAGPLGALLDAIAADLGARGVRLEGVDRALYHSAAVLVSNDVIALASAASRAWTLAGLPAGEAREALAPLLLAAARNVGILPLERALTGPVARGDVATVERHLRALQADPDLRDLYRALALELLRLDLGHPASLDADLRDALSRR